MSPSRNKNAPATFSFTRENLARAEAAMAKYPKGKQASAVLPLLDLAQRRSGGWLPREAMDYVAAFLAMPPARVYEVATFYSMFNLKPVGDHHIQVCRGVACHLRGADKVTEACCRKLGVPVGETTADGKFTLKEVECLGACTCGAAAQINDDYYENLTPEGMEKILDDLAAGRKPKQGAKG
ncbi:MAG: NADH-quinone oxidoreductase subunit NuoE [Alphaproteobacteria bacterium]|nr:NADH-quinone oxidoreductase subunit NuoE [Alphaproteobacteria bacterium]